jgi:hypothetical protein
VQGKYFGRSPRRFGVPTAHMLARLSVERLIQLLSLGEEPAAIEQRGTAPHHVLIDLGQLSLELPQRRDVRQPKLDEGGDPVPAGHEFALGGEDDRVQ